MQKFIYEITRSLHSVAVIKVYVAALEAHAYAMYATKMG